MNRILSRVVLWTNTNDGNNHHLVAEEQPDGKWKLTLYVRKPTGEEQDVECSELLECTLHQLIDACRHLGPTWAQVWVKDEQDFEATRDAPIPGVVNGKAMKLRWNVHHDGTGQPIQLDDSLELLEA